MSCLSRGEQSVGGIMINLHQWQDSSNFRLPVSQEVNKDVSI